MNCRILRIERRTILARGTGIALHLPEPLASNPASPVRNMIGKTGPQVEAVPRETSDSEYHETEPGYEAEIAQAVSGGADGGAGRGQRRDVADLEKGPAWTVAAPGFNRSGGEDEFRRIAI